MAGLGFNTSASTLILNNLNKLSAQLAISNERLATTKRINRASDDPTGLVAVSQYQSQIADINAMTTNGQKVNSYLDTADGAMAEITTLLDTIQTNITLASDVSATPSDKAGYQAIIDTSIDAIDSLVNNTTFNGQRLLDGSIGYNTANVTSSELTDVRITSADTSAGTLSPTISVTAAATKASRNYGGGTISPVDITITGNKGSESISFGPGTTNVTNTIAAINAVSATTGVIASDPGNGTVLIESEYYGADQFATIDVTSGTFFQAGSTEYGTDATVTVDGTNASVSGFEVSFNTGTLSGSLTLTEAFGTAVGSSTFDITSGGANFQLSASASSQIQFGVSSLRSSNLGNNSMGLLSTLKSGGTNDIDSGNMTQATNILDVASGQVSFDRARLGAISSYTVNSTLNSLAATKTSLTTAMSHIQDLDIAAETAENSRLQTLMSVNTALLSTINSNNSNILTLLYGM